MLGSENSVTLVGNLGTDPEIRAFGKVCSLRIATSERWRDKNSGQNREKTERHTVAIFQEGLPTYNEYKTKSDILCESNGVDSLDKNCPPICDLVVALMFGQSKG